MSLGVLEVGMGRAAMCNGQAIRAWEIVNEPLGAFGKRKDPFSLSAWIIPWYLYWVGRVQTSHRIPQ